MSKAGGLVLILGGLAVASFALLSDDGASGPDAGRQTDFAKSARVDERPGQDTAVLKPAFRPIASAPAHAAETPPSFSAPVVVTIAPRPSEPAAASRTAAIPRDRDALARELQKELRRVGCYEGELNGAWTPSTRRAMKAFTERVNATLPVEEPDAVLFAMVQGQQDRVCGKPCPAGQGISEDGRCLPNAILAKAAKKMSPPTVTAHAPSAGKPASAITGWSTTTAAAAPAPVVAATAVPPNASTQLPAPAPTEGRMALAGPLDDPTLAGAAPPLSALPGAIRPPGPLAPPKAVAKGRSSWLRTMYARRFDSPN